jgi:hypothetical protein
VDWVRDRARNIPLLKKLIGTYGTCAMIARDGGKVVATIRFYPKALCSFSNEGTGFCLQQDSPAGPKDDLAMQKLRPLDELPDKTLFVHCLMIAPAGDEPDRYRRKGLATRMSLELIRWAKENRWKAIEATAYEDIPFLYAISGVAGRRFWEKLDFRVIHQDIEPGISGEFLEKARKDAVSAGIPISMAANRYRMRRELATIGPG